MSPALHAQACSLPLKVSIDLPTIGAARSYLLSVAHWLVFDGHRADGTLARQDAPSAALHALADQLGIDVSV